jgi:hypothetical protein
MSKQWFDVDKEGLAKLLAEAPPASIVYEIVANALDTNATKLDVRLVPAAGPYVDLIVEDDDPDGFADLAHAYTLFAESSRKVEPTKRGRFNLGEKLVLARCVRAEIISTTGGVLFDADGRHPFRRKTVKGSKFEARVRMTRAEYGKAIGGVRQIILTPAFDPDVQILLNGEPLPGRRMGIGFKATLPTVLGDAEGNLRATKRECFVSTHECVGGESARLYEMGIPICELDGGETQHLNVRQKVPLTLDRREPTPAFLRALRVALLNAAPEGVTDATAPWVREAASEPGCSDKAINHVFELRFGDKRVSSDPSDTEANKLAADKGYSVVHGGSMSAGEWENARRAEAILPAGRVTPSHMSATPSNDFRVVPEYEWTDGMKGTARLAKLAAWHLLGIESLSVQLIDKARTISSCASWFRDGPSLSFNVTHLGKKWFDLPARARLPLILHELGHHLGGSDHRSETYYDELCRLGVELAYRLDSIVKED